MPNEAVQSRVEKTLSLVPEGQVISVSDQYRPSSPDLATP